MNRLSSPDLVPDFDVGPVQGAHRQRAVQGELHVARARRFLARRGDLLAEVGRRDDLFRQRHAVIRQEDHPEQPPRPGVVVDDLAHVVDELDDLLGGPIPRRRLAGQNAGARRGRLPAVFHQGEIFVDDEHDEQQLPLVLVDALDLHIEQRVRVYGCPQCVLHVAGQGVLVGLLGGGEPLPETCIVGERFQGAQLLQVGDPAVADGLGDQCGQGRVGLEQPAARRHAVGLVIKFLRPELVEVGDQGRLDEFGVHGRDAVDRVAADNRQVRHADLRRRGSPR